MILNKHLSRNILSLSVLALLGSCSSSGSFVKDRVPQSTETRVYELSEKNIKWMNTDDLSSLRESILKITNNLVAKPDRALKNYMTRVNKRAFENYCYLGTSNKFSDFQKKPSDFGMSTLENDANPTFGYINKTTGSSYVTISEDERELDLWSERIFYVAYHPMCPKPRTGEYPAPPLFLKVVLGNYSIGEDYVVVLIGNDINMDSLYSAE